jgi:hypothetical protein
MYPFNPFSDSPSITYTTGGYTKLTYDPTGTITDGVQIAYSDSNFEEADDHEVQFRLVGAGLRVFYQGSEFKRGGQVILHRQTQNDSVPIGSNPSQLLQFRTTTQAPAIRNTECVTYQPSNFDMLGYSYNNRIAVAPLLIFISGAEPAVSWGFEAVSHFECIGDRQEKTASHSDPTGMAAVMSALPTKVAIAPPTKVEAVVNQRANANVAESSSVTTMLLNGVGSAIKGGMSLLGGPVGNVIGSLAQMGITQGINNNYAYAALGPPQHQSVRVEEVDFD